MRIVELTIDQLDELAGFVDAISLVEKPAHESNWLAFKQDGKKKNIYDVLTKEQLIELAIEINKLGEPVGTLEAEGWELEKIEKVSDPNHFIEVISNPNEVSGEDSRGAYRIRYRYTGPQDSKNRDFCAEMLRQGRVFRREDIDEMTSAMSNPEFGFYSIWEFRGSYNCRHYWQKLTYRDTGTIVNKSRSRRGLTGTEDIPNEPTKNRATINKEAEREAQAQANRISTSMLEFGVVDIIDDVPLFDSKEEALVMAEKIGCSGYHEHIYGEDEVGYMPCEKHIFESYNDYPKAASENACKVLRWIDEHGRDEVKGMTQTGLARANQLCKGENISEDTIARMSAFERHRKNAEISEENKGTPWKDKGYVAWLGWGGDEGVAWAQRKLQSIRMKVEEPKGSDLGGDGLALPLTGQTDEEFLRDNPCTAGYVAYGTKMKNGRKVPNCVPMSSVDEGLEDFKFNADDEKMEITGAAIIPNKMIIRKSPPTFEKPNGEFYWVFFSEETTRKLADRFMKAKLLDASNIEHSEKDADSYVKESWIVDDPIFDKSTSMGLEYPKGTWVVTMKVNDPKVWKDIKNGKLNGYSIEGWFNENVLFN
tara:strand:- start:7280 stop:9061 length:1782 start_codon:yes stop_codon:yes gene_type:complete